MKAEIIMHNGNSFRYVAVIFLLLTFCTTGFSQTISESLFTQNQKKQQKSNQEMISLEKLIKKIESDQHIIFLYKTLWLKNKYVPANTLEQDSLELKLGAILQKEGLTYSKITARSYAIQPQAKLVEKPMEQIQIETVRGQVTDASSNESLPGVNVVVKGTTTGTSTDGEGNYELDVPSLQDTLVFSFIGYQKRQVPINGRTTVNIQLQSQAISGEELVVVGYGTQERRDLTGSVSTVPTEDLSQQPVSSVDQALQGKTAGVQVTSTSSQPGGGTTIRIRGTNSINSGSEPLYVIDGVPISNDLGGYSSGAVRGANFNPLSTLNPSDIESIQVLKDASAQAIYGARGANGVVLIETKRGQAGQTNVAFSSYYGIQEVRKKLLLLNATEFGQFANDAAINAGNPIPYQNPESFGEGTDWQDELYRTAPIQNYHISVSGGDQSTRYSLSGGFYNQQGIVVGSDLTRGTLKLNLDKNVSDRLHIGNSLNISRATTNIVSTEGTGGASSGLISKALHFNPILPVYQDDGAYTYQNDIGGFKLGNPVAEGKEIDNESNNTRIFGDLFAEYTIIEGLEVRVSFGGDVYYNKENLFVPNYLKRTVASNGEAAVSTAERFTWLNENTINYQTRVNDIHRLDILAGFTVQGFKSNNLSASVQDFSNNITGYNNIGAAASTLSFPSTGTSEWSLVSYIGRTNYILQDTYLFTLTGRVDGSSRFGSGNKYGFFPSGAVAWRASNEPFIQNLDYVSNLKFRVSYGQIGNQSIPPYSSLSLLNATTTYFNDSQTAIGYRPNSLSNAKLKWEVTSQLDVGLDIGFINDRLSLTADYYYKKTSDLLLNSPIPYTIGYNDALLNIGDLENRGFELSINTTNVEGEFGWNTSFNLSANRNKVTNLAGRDSLITGNFLLAEGKPVSSFYGYLTDGIFQMDDDIANTPQFPSQNAQPGDRRYKDLNGDGVINADDRTIIGGAAPDYILGLTNNFYYKGFQLDVFIQGSGGNEVANQNNFFLEDFTAQANHTTVALERWTPENPSNKYPRANAQPEVGLQFSDAIVEDASYLRLKRLTLGYNLPASVLDRLKLQNLRLYAQATNLLTFTDYDGYDPEVNINGQSNVQRGVDGGAYPSARTFTLGINIGL